MRTSTTKAFPVEVWLRQEEDNFQLRKCTPPRDVRCNALQKKIAVTDDKETALEETYNDLDIG